MDGAKGWFERRLKEAEVSWWLMRHRGLAGRCRVGDTHATPGERDWSSPGTF